MATSSSRAASRPTGARKARPRDRFYAFDKKTGELVWASSPSDRPKDNSFSHPQLGWRNGKRVFYTALGDGSVAVRQRPHRRTHLARAAVPRRHQRHRARPQQRQAHRHLRRAVRTRPVGRAEDSGRRAHERRRRPGGARAREASNSGRRTFRPRPVRPFWSATRFMSSRKRAISAP